jgi:flavin-dependent dehydrogenase
MEHTYSAVRGYWSGVSGLDDSIELYFIDGVLPGYLWIFPMAGGMANVGLGILSSDLRTRKHPTVTLQEAIAKHPAIAPKFANAKQVGKTGGWAIPNGSYKKPNTGDGWVLIGDAASLVDPFSGEGVGNALTSGKYAAMAINSALDAHKDGAGIPASSLKAYEEKVAAHLRPEIQNSYRIQRLSRHRVLLNLFIGKAADKPEVRQMLVDMLGSSEEKKKVVSPMFYLKLLLP